MLLLRTAETRWFQRGPLSDAVSAWFDALGPPVDVSSRTDRYLLPASAGLGVKVREGRLEAKRRDGTAGRLAVAAAVGTVEAWSKWSFALAEDDAPDRGWVAVAKARRQREHATGGGVCRIELSEVEAAGKTWWSVCLEADGPDSMARRRALTGAAALWLGRPDAPALPAEAAMGYPAWLIETAG